MESGAFEGISPWEAWYQDSRAGTAHSHKPSTTRGMEDWEVRPWTPQPHRQLRGFHSLQTRGAPLITLVTGHLSCFASVLSRFTYPLSVILGLTVQLQNTAPQTREKFIPNLRHLTLLHTHNGQALGEGCVCSFLLNRWQKGGERIKEGLGKILTCSLSLPLGTWATCLVCSSGNTSLEKHSSVLLLGICHRSSAGYGKETEVLSKEHLQTL